MSYTRLYAERRENDRRSGIDRRRFSYSEHIPERRSGIDRRTGMDRRSGLDRRVAMEAEDLVERRSAGKRQTDKK